MQKAKKDPQFAAIIYNLLYIEMLEVLIEGFHTNKSHPGEMLKSGEEICSNDGRERRRNRRREGGDKGVGRGVLIVSHTRVVSQTDLHTRPQGILGSVCLSLEPRSVGGLLTTLYTLPVPVFFFSSCVLLSLCLLLSFFLSVSLNIFLLQSGSQSNLLHSA